MREEVATRRGRLFVISGPSGVGKGSVVELLLERVPDLFLSVSCTTRRPRDGEIEGASYRFLGDDEFSSMVEAGDFLEWAEVFGNRYGTLAEPIEQARAGGRDAVLEIDIQGARTVKEAVPDAVLVFLEPPTEAELQKRLLGRGTEDDNELARRLTAAADEMSNAAWFEHIVVNDELEKATSAVAGIIEAHRSERGGTPERKSL